MMFLFLLACGPRNGGLPPTTQSTLADVVGVETSGDAGATTFAVTLRSPDTGCDQYASWWEVLDTEGALLYRRILGHSHVDEQPFTRTGGPVALAPDQVVWVRAHLHPAGYGGAAFHGSLSDGFQAAALTADWDLRASEEPLPTGCAF